MSRETLVSEQIECTESGASVKDEQEIFSIIAHADRDPEHAADYVVGYGSALEIVRDLFRAGFLIRRQRRTKNMSERPEEINDPRKFRDLMLTNDGRHRFNRWVRCSVEGAEYQKVAERYPEFHIYVDPPDIENFICVAGIVGKASTQFYVKRIADVP